MTTPGVTLSFGSRRWALKPHPTLRRVPLPDDASVEPLSALRDALERPLRFHPLRKALTPDDRIVIVLDERLPLPAVLLGGLLEYLCSAGIRPGAVTVLCPPPATAQGWIDDLPDDFADVRIEVHQPDDRNRLAYLATTAKGRRIYLNRTLIDADQVIILAGCGYDAVQGYAGGAGTIFPGLSDTETRTALARRGKAHEAEPTRTHREAIETAWLLGAPFFVRVIPDSGSKIRHIVGGLAETEPDADRLLDQRWRYRPTELADLVIATIAAPCDFAAAARALRTASQAVETDGRLILLGEMETPRSAALDVLRAGEEPRAAIRILKERRPDGWPAALDWAFAAAKCRIYAALGQSEEWLEDHFAVPLTEPSNLDRLLESAAAPLLLPDAERTYIDPIL